MHVELYHRLMNFKMPSGTSRGILKQKSSWFLRLTDEHKVSGIGECSIIDGLSPDMDNGLLETLAVIKTQKSLHPVSSNEQLLDKLPALRFAIETAELDLKAKGTKHLFDSEFLRGAGIPINGLVWMGTKQFMFDQIKAKIEEGYSCIKIKIAAIDFEEELSLLKYIRSQFSEKDIELRVDANGGFEAGLALEKLSKLSVYKLHSIEQPIAVNNHEEMARLCEASPVSIALDEELIGITSASEKAYILDTIRPQYIILKPSLLGGYEKSEEWIKAATDRGIAWWVTSALEANIGLNAIAQWTATLDNPNYQGLGTGQLFTNNIPSPLHIEQGKLFYNNSQWGSISN